MTRRSILLLAAALALPGPAFAQAVYPGDSGAVSASATPSGTHSAGSSVGGLFSLPIARTAVSPFNSGIITSVLWKSTGGSTGALVARAWQRKPTNTTCTDGSAFAGSDTDDAFLIGGGPFSLTPAAPAATTGDTATYASSTGLTWDYANTDTTGSNGNATAPSQNIYMCFVTVSSDTVDVGHLVRVTVSGPQN